MSQPRRGLDRGERIAFGAKVAATTAGICVCVALILSGDTFDVVHGIVLGVILSISLISGILNDNWAT